MDKPNCEKCRYRIWLARYGGHVWGEDCDQYGTDFCKKKMNEPDFIKFMEGKNGKSV